jgi:hypothetical protein
MSIKDMVSNNKQVTFVEYCQGYLWYQTECGFLFPVPIDDTGDAKFAATDKAMLYMRWIRKHLAFLEKARADQTTA